MLCVYIYIENVHIFTHVAVYTYIYIVIHILTAFYKFSCVNSLPLDMLCIFNHFG